MSSTDKFTRRTVSGDAPPQHKKPVSDYLQRVLDSMADLSRNPAKAQEVEKSGGSYEIVKPSR